MASRRGEGRLTLPPLAPPGLLQDRSERVSNRSEYMYLRQKHHFCIWCGRVLWDGAQSSEHVIPHSLGGRLISVDVCAACNNRFGGETDWKLLHDKRVFEAAIAAGVPAEEFLGSYEAVTLTNSGNEVRLRVVDGISRVIKGLSAVPVHIGSDEQGRFRPSDVEALRRMKRAEAKTRLPHIDPAVVEAEVDRIVDGVFKAGPGAQSSSELLGEGFAIDVSSQQVSVSRTFNEFESFQAIAKILFTVVSSVLPDEIHSRMADVMAHAKRFALDEIRHPNPIRFEQLRRPATRRHCLAVRLGSSGFCFEIILFDVLRWWIEGYGVSKAGDVVALPTYLWEAIDERAAPDVVIATR